MNFFCKILIILGCFFINSQLFGNFYYLDENLSITFQDELVDKTYQQEVHNYAKDIKNIVNKTIAKANQDKNCNFLINIYHSPANRVEFESGEEEFKINIYSNLEQFNEDFFLKYYLVCAIVQKQLNLSEDEVIFRLPFWIFLALNDTYDSTNEQLKVIRRSRNLTGLKVLIEYQAIEKFQLLSELKNIHYDVVSRLIFQDFSRFIFEVVVVRGEKQVVNRYLMKVYQNQIAKNPIDKKLIFSQIITKFLQDDAKKKINPINIVVEKSEDEIFKEYLYLYANHFAYSRSNPYHAALAKEKLEELQTINLPNLDLHNKFNNSYTEIELVKLPQLMKSYPHAIRLRTQIILNFYEYRNSVSSLLVNRLNNLLKNVQKCRDTWWFPVRESTLKDSLAEVFEEIDRQEKIEKLLDKASHNHLNLFQLYPIHMKIFESKTYSEPTQNINILLKNSEEKYYGTF